MTGGDDGGASVPANLRVPVCVAVTRIVHHTRVASSASTRKSWYRASKSGSASNRSNPAVASMSACFDRGPTSGATNSKSCANSASRSLGLVGPSCCLTLLPSEKYLSAFSIICSFTALLGAIGCRSALTSCIS